MCGKSMTMSSIVLTLFLAAMPADADPAQVVDAEFRPLDDGWHVSVTVRHDDTGRDHYADAWRLVDRSGAVLGVRTLHHPHVNEQPFTRSLGGVAIPAGTRIVYIEARDNVSGWSHERLKVDLGQPRGDGYRVIR